MSATYTYHCHCCDQRKPMDGFRLLAGRRVPVCPDCLPIVEPYLVALEDFRRRVDEQAAAFVVGLIRRANESGQAAPAPEEVAEQIDEATSRVA